MSLSTAEQTRIAERLDNMSEAEAKEILQRLARIEQRLSDIGLPDRATCAVHSRILENMERRMSGVEAQVGKHNLISASIGAVAAGVVLALKYVVTK